MKYLGIFNGQKIDSIFTEENALNLFYETTKDNLQLRVGYIYIDSFFLTKYLAIRMSNSIECDEFELFEMDNLQVSSLDEMTPIACQTAEKIIQYNKDIIQYYSQKK